MVGRKYLSYGAYLTYCNYLVMVANINVSFMKMQLPLKAPDLISALKLITSRSRLAKRVSLRAHQCVLDIYPYYNIVEAWLKKLDEPAAFGQKYRLLNAEPMAARWPCRHGYH